MESPNEGGNRLVVVVHVLGQRLCQHPGMSLQKSTEQTIHGALGGFSFLTILQILTLPQPSLPLRVSLLLLVLTFPVHAYVYSMPANLWEAELRKAGAIGWSQIVGLFGSLAAFACLFFHFGRIIGFAFLWTSLWVAILHQTTKRR